MCTVCTDVCIASAIAKDIGGFKFGGSVWDRHMYNHNYVSMGFFRGTAGDCQTAKFNSPPNILSIWQ